MVHSASWLRFWVTGIKSCWILHIKDCKVLIFGQEIIYIRMHKTYTCCSSFIPSFPTSWQLPSLENVGWESPALLSAISSTSLPNTSMGSKSITSNNVSSHAFATTRTNKQTSVMIRWSRVVVVSTSVKSSQQQEYDYDSPGSLLSMDERIDCKKLWVKGVNWVILRVSSFLHEHSRFPVNNRHDVFWKTFRKLTEQIFFFELRATGFKIGS